MEGAGDGVVVQRVAQLPGMAAGELGLAGVDKSGPTIRAVVIPAWRYIATEVAWFYLNSFLGLLAIDGMGLADLAPPGEAFAQLATIAGVAMAPTILALLQELYRYLGQVRASRS